MKHSSTLYVGVDVKESIAVAYAAEKVRRRAREAAGGLWASLMAQFPHVDTGVGMVGEYGPGAGKGQWEVWAQGRPAPAGERLGSVPRTRTRNASTVSASRAAGVKASRATRQSVAIGEEAIVADPQSPGPRSRLFNRDLNAPVLLPALRVVATVGICVWGNRLRLTEAAGRNDRFGNAFLFYQPVLYRLRAPL